MVETQHDVLVQQAERGTEGGQQDRSGPGIPGRRRVEPVLAEQLVRSFLELGAEDVTERHRPPAGLDDGHGLGGGEIAAPAPCECLERLGDRLHRAEVGTGAHDHLGAGVPEPADRRLEVPHGDRLVDPVGDVVGADENDGGIRASDGIEGVGDLDAEVAGDGAHDGHVGEPYPPARERGHPGGEDGADGLVADLRAEPGGAAVTDDQQLERGSGRGAVDAVVLGSVLRDHADRNAGEQRLGLDQPVADDSEHADARDAEPAPVRSRLGDPARAPCTSPWHPPPPGVLLAPVPA